MQFWATLVPIATCFLASTLYHTFSANHRCYSLWLALDVSPIRAAAILSTPQTWHLCSMLTAVLLLAQVCGIFLVGVGYTELWFGLHCHPSLRLLVCACYVAAAAACMNSALRARTPLRPGLPLLVLLAARVASLAARPLLLPAVSGTQHYLCMEALCIAGGAINAARVPERWLQPPDPCCPAPLDYWLNSHQLMHLLVVAAMYHLQAGAQADHALVTALGSGALRCRAPS